MAYNNGRENRKWLIWKEAEEKILREHGVDETTPQIVLLKMQGYSTKEIAPLVGLRAGGVIYARLNHLRKIL